MLENFSAMPAHLKIVLILTVGFALATVLGYLTERVKLSPILGYLLAGYIIGPFSPGFVADLEISEQLAEVGVILMMFGVGLHLKWQELAHVKYVAFSGALGQTLFSSLVGVLLIVSSGWSFEAAVIIGLSIGIASTVVLVHVLSDNKVHNTPAGHIALSWLLCEDLIAVFALLLLPSLAAIQAGFEPSFLKAFLKLSMIFVQFSLWLLLMFTIGQRVVSFVLNKIIVTHSRELFTVATLALTFAIAFVSAMITGSSIALGAFIAGIIIGQTALRSQVSANVMPLKETFVVIFFLSIGMLFNPIAIAENFTLFIGILAIILVAKPMAAFVIVKIFNYPTNTAVIVAMALAQIGEFSFILAEEATKLHILPDEGYDIIVACAFVSLAINPLIFKFLVKHKLAA